MLNSMQDLKAKSVYLEIKQKKTFWQSLNILKSLNQ